MRKLRAMAGAFGLAVILASTATPASAEVRTLTASLPSDAQPTISGVPDNPDVRQVHIVYDTAGSLTITVDFWHPVNALDLSQNYAFYANFSIGTADVSSGLCLTYQDGITGQHHVFSNVETFYDQATVAGYGGTLTFSRTVSPDNMEITIAASNTALANHNWDCAVYALHARTYSTLENLYSHYDESCDCWYVTSTLDTITGSSTSFVYFDGFPPPPPPPPPLHTLTVSIAGSGQGSVTGSGISCRPNCSRSYADGYEVNLRETPKPGSRFTGWSGAACFGLPENECVAFMFADTQVRATFAAQPPTLSALSVSPRKFEATRTGPPMTGAPKLGTKVHFTLNTAASVIFTIQRSLEGRRVAGRCEPTSRTNRAKSHCTRWVTLPDGFSMTGRGGSNDFRFSGSLNGHKLSTGTYGLTATPTTAGRTGKVQSISFQILR